MSLLTLATPLFVELAQQLASRSSTLAHGIPTRLVLPMIMAAPDHHPRLRPDQVCPDHEPRSQQRILDLADMPRAVPNISNIAREQRPDLTPVGDTTRDKPKRSLSLSICADNVIGSAVLPSNTSPATGQPSAAHSRPQAICSLPFLPSPAHLE